MNIAYERIGGYKLNKCGKTYEDFNANFTDHLKY